MHILLVLAQEQNTRSPLDCLSLLGFLNDVTFRCSRVLCAPAAWGLSSVNRSSGQLNSQSSGIPPSDVASPVLSSTGWVTHPAIPGFQKLITGAFFHFRATGNAFLQSQNTGFVIDVGLRDFLPFFVFLAFTQEWAVDGGLRIACLEKNTSCFCLVYIFHLCRYLLDL